MNSIVESTGKVHGYQGAEEIGIELEGGSKTLFPRNYIVLYGVSVSIPYL